jgi:hypothetical protein
MERVAELATAREKFDFLNDAAADPYKAYMRVSKQKGMSVGRQFDVARALRNNALIEYVVSPRRGYKVLTFTVETA